MGEMIIEAKEAPPNSGKINARRNNGLLIL